MFGLQGNGKDVTIAMKLEPKMKGDALRQTAITAVAALAISVMNLAPAGAAESDPLVNLESVVDIAAEGLESAVEVPGTVSSFAETNDLLQAGESKIDPEFGSIEIGSTGMTVTLPVAEDLTLTSDGFAAATDPDSGLAVVVMPHEGGASVRVLTVADESYGESEIHEYAYGIDLAPGTELRQLSNGQVVVVDTNAFQPVDLQPWAPGAEVDLGDYAAGLEVAAEGIGEADPALEPGEVVVASFQPAWAIDATGMLLPTNYEVVGNTLTQVVDTTGASFPVVADPLPLILIKLGAVVATWGVPVSAGAFTVARIVPGVTLAAQHGYRSFYLFKVAAGPAKPGYQWHHIVEQTQAARFGALLIHNTRNLVQIPTRIHQQCVNSRMATSRVPFTLRINGQTFNFVTGSTMRSQVHARSLQEQHLIGVALLRYCGVDI